MDHPSRALLRQATMSAMAISARDQLIASLQQKLGAAEAALSAAHDDLEARESHTELLQVPGWRLPDSG